MSREKAEQALHRIYRISDLLFLVPLLVVVWIQAPSMEWKLSIVVAGLFLHYSFRLRAARQAFELLLCDGDDSDE